MTVTDSAKNHCSLLSTFIMEGKTSFAVRVDVNKDVIKTKTKK